MAEYLLAIDGGTGSVRSCLFDYSGNRIGIAGREWTHLQDARYSGSMNFDCAGNWSLIKDTIKSVLAQTGVDPAEITAVAATAMREGIVLYDKDANEIFALANVDSRAGKEVAELKTFADGIEEDIYKRSGQTFSLGALARLLWVKNNLPDVYEKTTTMNMLNDWITFKLTGELVAEPSNGCTTGIFDIKNRCWDASILEKCGLKTDIFPRVSECGVVVGNISEKCAYETGLSRETLVVSGGGDAQLGALGIGCVNDGQCAVFGGSFWQFECNTSAPKTDDRCRIRVNCHAIPGMWQYEAIAFFPGLLMKWYKNAFCAEEVNSETNGGRDAYSLMEEKAKDVPAGCHGMLCMFSDVMNYISWRHAAPTFTDFSFDDARFNKYTFYRAVMESAAFVTRGHMELIEDTAAVKPNSVTFAGGASNSPLWCQILADVLNVNISVPRVREATALGAAILAGIGAGIYKDAADAAAKVSAVERVYTPNPENKAVYDQMYNKWRAAYKVQLALADAGVTRYMWNAPGTA